MEELENTGLTRAEVKVYMALLELGSSKAGPIVRASGLQNSVTHLALQKLVAKGFVSYVKKGKVKHYAVTDPKNISRYLENQKAQFDEEVLPKLLARQTLPMREEAEVFEGERGFRSMLYKFIEDAVPGDDYLFFAFMNEDSEEERKTNAFYADFARERLRRGLELKGIAPSYQRPLFERRPGPLPKFVDYPTITNTSVCGNKVIFTPWEQGRIVSFMITSNSMSSMLSNHFYSVWNII